MSTRRVYMLLNISGRDFAKVAKTLHDQRGVVIADILEGPPDIILVIRAPNRQKLADRAIRAVASVENMIEDIKLLPVIASPGTNTRINDRR